MSTRQSTRDLLGTDSYPSPPATMARALRPLGRAAMRRRWDIHVYGAEHVPARGPVLLAGNHIGLLDGPLLLALAPRTVHAWVKREMFDGVSGSVFRAMGQISLERGGVDPAAVKTAVRVLRSGGAVAVYPEGARGDGTVSHTRLGLAYLATVTGAQVVPVAHLGTRLPGGGVGSTPPRGSRLSLVFGPGTDVPRRPWPRRRSDIEQVAEDLRLMLAAHVQHAVELTQQSLPGRPFDESVDAAGREGPEVGPTAQEERR
jgi:1-acyl-sn-glycerol-3-phosphate acyltransferase